MLRLYLKQGTLRLKYVLGIITYSDCIIAEREDIISSTTGLRVLRHTKSGFSIDINLRMTTTISYGEYAMLRIKHTL